MLASTSSPGPNGVVLRAVPETAAIEARAAEVEVLGPRGPISVRLLAATRVLSLFIVTPS